MKRLVALVGLVLALAFSHSPVRADLSNTGCSSSGFCNPTYSCYYPLDFLPAAAAAYSVRKLRFSYAGNALNLRRASDSTTLDIGFVSGGCDLDTAAAATFCAATSCLITKAYDQSVNVRDSSQGTAASQPAFIQNALNGHPVMRSSGVAGVSSTPLVTSATFTIAQPFTYAAVSKRTSGTSFSVIGLFATSNGEFGFHTANKAYADAGATLDATATDNVTHMITATLNGVSSNIMVDGVTTSGTAGAGHPSAQVFNLFSGAANSGPLNGDTPEVLVFSAALSTAQITALQNNQRAYYGL